MNKIHGRQKAREIEPQMLQMTRMFEQQSNQATKKEKSGELCSFVSSPAAP